MKLKNVIFPIIILQILIGCSGPPVTIDPAKMQKIFLNAQLLAKEKKGFPCMSLEEVTEELLFWFLRADANDITSYKYPFTSARSDRDVISIHVQLKDSSDANFALDVKLKNDEAEIVCYDLSQIYCSGIVILAT